MAKLNKKGQFGAFQIIGYIMVVTGGGLAVFGPNEFIKTIGRFVIAIGLLISSMPPVSKWRV